MSTLTSSPKFFSHHHLFFNLLSFLLVVLTFNGGSTGVVNAAITTPLSRNGDFVEQNGDGTWCFYPTALDPLSIDVACVGPSKGDYAMVLDAHLNRTTSINYFSASATYLGGPEYVVGATVNSTSDVDPDSDESDDTPVQVQQRRKVYMCLSGRAGDYSYQTMCTTVGKDNSLGAGGPSPFCKVQTAQRRVTDGCYIPNQQRPSVVVVGPTGTVRPAIVSVTRTVGTGSAAAVVTGLSQSSGGGDESGAGLRSYRTALGAVTLSAIALAAALL